MEICLIWAEGPNREIGKNNTLPWHVPEDLQYFKRMTMGAPLIMGRRTFESLPGKLPGRQLIVLSRGPRATVGGCPAVQAASLEDAILMAASLKAARCFVIGGASVYEQALPWAHRVFRTRLDGAVPGADAFAPQLPDTFFLAHQTSWQQSVSGTHFQMQEWKRRESVFQQGTS